MKTRNLILVIGLSLGFLLAGYSAVGMAGQNSTAEKSGKDNATFPVYATGTQIYQCKPGTSQWELKEPKAELFDSSGKKIGTHFKDVGGPAWQSEAYGKPTSKVVADTKKRSVADDPLNENIPMLWLGVLTNEGTGMFGKIKSIQRVNTIGGMAPKEPCKPNEESPVKYSATYYFYKR